MLLIVDNSMVLIMTLHLDLIIAGWSMIFLRILHLDIVYSRLKHDGIDQGPSPGYCLLLSLVWY
jgi:hypothetical protein